MDKSRHDFFSSKVQEINVMPQGDITHSNNTLFKVEIGDNLYSLHPFFESMQQEISQGQRSYLAFPCVQLELNGKTLVCDITIKKERDFLAVLLFDFTQRYQDLQQKAQDKNSALLQEQTRKFKNEKEAFKKFTNHGTELSILKELERAIVLMEQLRATELSPEQATLLHEMDGSIGILYHKALQINANVDMDFD